AGGVGSWVVEWGDGVVWLVIGRRTGRAPSAGSPLPRGIAAECSLAPRHRAGERSSIESAGAAPRGRERPDGDAPEEGRGSLSLRKSAPPCRLAPNRQRESGGGRPARPPGRPRDMAV